MLNENHLKFQDLSPEDQLLLIQYVQQNDNIEIYHMKEWILVHSHKIIALAKIYRIPSSKPSINWDHVDKKWNYLAIDADDIEATYLYTNKPCISGMYWKVESGPYKRIDNLFSSFKPGNCDWKDSLIERPQETTNDQSN